MAKSSRKSGAPKPGGAKAPKPGGFTMPPPGGSPGGNNDKANKGGGKK